MTTCIRGCLIALGIITCGAWTAQAGPVAKPIARAQPSRPTPVRSISPAMQLAGQRSAIFPTISSGAMLSPTVSAFQLNQLGFLNNQLWGAASAYSMFGYGSPYGYGGFGGYGGSGGGYPMMSNPYGNAGTSVNYISPYAYGSSNYVSPYASSSSTPTVAQPSVTSVTAMLTSLGIANQDSKPAWPLGLQVLFPQKENMALLQQLQVLLSTAADQKLSGQENSELVQQAQRAVDRLHSLLRDRAIALPSRDYRESEQFLNRLREAFKALQYRG